MCVTSVGLGIVLMLHQLELEQVEHLNGFETNLIDKPA